MFASPSQGLKLTLPTTAEPVPPGLPELAGPVLLPHQLSVALSDPLVWRLSTPTVSPDRLSSLAVRVLVSLAPEPATMPEPSPVIVLSVTVAALAFSDRNTDGVARDGSAG